MRCLPECRFQHSYANSHGSPQKIQGIPGASWLPRPSELTVWAQMKDLASVYKMESNQGRDLKSFSDLCMHMHTSAWMRTHTRAHVHHTCVHISIHTYACNPHQKVFLKLEMVARVWNISTLETDARESGM